MSNNVVLIVSGYNNRAIISFCRFCKDKSIPFYIAAADESDIIKLTIYRENIIDIRKSKQLTVDNFLSYQKTIKKLEPEKNIVILPSTEYLNRFLLNNLESLESIGFVIPLTNVNLYEEISDKYSFGELCERYNINIPKEYNAVNEAAIPFVAKPKSYFKSGLISSEKPILIMNKEDYGLFIKEDKKEDFYYQEFVGGQSFYLLYYFAKDKSYSVYSQRNFIQQDNGLSIIGAKSSNFHKHEVENKFSNMFMEIGFEGIIMVEIKQYNEKIYMIEANPRLWGPSQLILDANMDLFHRFALDYNLINKEKEYTFSYLENETYFWSGGICQDLENGNQPVFHDYDEITYFNEYHNWIKNDIYLKNDTIDIYMKENER